MANSTFQLPPDYHLMNSNPSPLPNYNMVDQSYSCSFFHGLDELSDYLGFEDEPISNFTAPAPSINLQAPLVTTHDLASSTGSSASGSSFDGMPITNHMQTSCKMKRESKRGRSEESKVVAFRTRTELETLDDGYKWRKYGKKMVKSNPNPRNYYKCSSVGCKVKKRIERDREDSSYLITTYEGTHNHVSPSIIYYDEFPIAFSSLWSQLIQPSRHPL